MTTPTGKTGGRIAALATRLGLKSAPDSFLAKALSELDEQHVDKPTWASAVSKASGKEDKARALYIRMRGQILADTAKEQQRTEERARGAEQELQQAEAERQDRMRQEAATRQQNTPDPDPAPDSYTCSNCHYHGVFRNESKPNLWILLLLLFPLVIPGLIYAVRSVNMVCPKCGTKA